MQLWLAANIYICKVEKKIQTDYTFISTSLFRGCPLVRRFNKNILYHRLYTINIHNNSSNEAKLNICMSAIA